MGGAQALDRFEQVHELEWLGQVAQDARRWAEEIGAQGYLAKPFEMPELLSVVERWHPNLAG